MLHSLRARLITSYAFVVFISLFLAGSGFLWLIQKQQMDRELDRLADIVLPLSVYVRYLELGGASPREIGAFLDDQAQQLNVRLLLVRTADRLVTADTADELEGYILPPPDEGASGNPGRLEVGRYQAATGQFVTISVAGTRALGRVTEQMSPGLVPRHAVMVSVPHSNLAGAWLALAPRLIFAGVLALFASIPLALWLSRSISRPLARITRASEEMARGRYEQRIPVERQDEIGRLGTAFNLMAKQVALSHRTLREFLADVSHELRTPLTSIRGFSQAMTDGTLHSRAEYLEAGRVIHEEAERMGRLVDALLYLSRVESGQFTGERHPLDLAVLVGACVQRAERRLAGRPVSLTFHGDAGLPPVKGEPHRLEQVVDNLLDNAIKHTPAGGQITVRLTPDASGNALQLTVHNTGSLIPADERERVFDRFYRGRGSSTGEGTGLGLAIARQIIESHNGRIHVASEPEAGTEFVVRLPAGSASISLSEPAPSRVSAPLEEQPTVRAPV
jgi:signal transduction histidine kinase